ncbi:MAG: hypothetical protein ABWZ25_04465 [Chitinophagaceae bacterium]
MRLLLMDTQHFEVLQTLLRLFGQFQHEMKVFTTAGSRKQLMAALEGEKLDISWEVQGEQESRRQFAWRFTLELRSGQYDLVALVTVADNHLIFARALKQMRGQKSLLTIHSLNGYFKYKPSFSLKRLVRFIGKNKLVKQSSLVQVLSYGVADEFRKLAAGSSPQKKVIVIPGSIYDPGRFSSRTLSQNENIRIVLPGAVDERRRNYEDVFRLLEKANELEIRITVILLGGILPEYSHWIRERIQQYNKEHDNLVSFGESDVDQAIFDRYMEECHFVWMPFKQAMIIQDGVEEYYGRSMNSGNLGDVIRYAKPFFVPRFIAIDTGLREIAQRYDQVDELLTVLQTMDPENYNRMVTSSRNVSMNYQLKTLTDLHLQLFRDLIP